ncbi:MAG: YraN family protein [Deltaproteobacteria bacterium]|nr:MAG: YraN family protein [Deltaproteobacteria bacterium]
MAIGHFLKKQDFSPDSLHKKLGVDGEALAAQYLQTKGFKVLVRNYRSRVGEIDLIIEKSGVIHFVEVKSRRRSDAVSPRELIPYSKQKKISKTAQEYLAKFKKEGSAVFSALLIDWAESETPKIEWIENAFELAYGY